MNFTAIYNSVGACLPHMLEHGEGGHFVTTASMGGLLPGVNAGVYTATKIAAVGIMEALRVELESTNIGTSVFCPGGVNTDNYVGTGEENPYRAAQPAGQRAALRPSRSMDPLEAGERVMNGVVNNDLFILSHPEFKPGMQERFDAIMASTPPVETPIPEDRINIEKARHALRHLRARNRPPRGPAQELPERLARIEDFLEHNRVVVLRVLRGEEQRHRALRSSMSQAFELGFVVAQLRLVAGTEFLPFLPIVAEPFA